LNQTRQEEWNKRYRSKDTEPHVAQVLQENQYLLPSHGKALEVASGLGGNALFLAQRGLDVSAWDISDVAVQKLDAKARDQGLRLTAEVRDIMLSPPPVASFDLIIVSRFFLEHDLGEGLVNALRPGGLLFYQTFTRSKVTEAGPSNPAYRLKDNELLHMFKELQVLVYREEGAVGDTTQGFRDEAMLVGRKQ
jgi:tellurite methyltransferase